MSTKIWAQEHKIIFWDEISGNFFLYLFLQVHLKNNNNNKKHVFFPQKQGNSF